MIHALSQKAGSKMQGVQTRDHWRHWKDSRLFTAFTSPLTTCWRFSLSRQRTTIVRLFRRLYLKVSDVSKIHIFLCGVFSLTFISSNISLCFLSVFLVSNCTPSKVHLIGKQNWSQRSGTPIAVVTTLQEELKLSDWWAWRDGAEYEPCA